METQEGIQKQCLEDYSLIDFTYIKIYNLLSLCYVIKLVEEHSRFPP